MSIHEEEDLDEGLMGSIKKKWQGGVQQGFKNNIHPDHHDKYKDLIARTKTFKQSVDNLDHVHPDHKKVGSIKKKWQGGVQQGFKNNIHPDHHDKYKDLIARTKTFKQAVDNLDHVHPDHKKDAVRKEEVQIKDALIDLMQGNTWEFKQGIDNALDSRIMDAIDTERFRVGSTLFDAEAEE